VRAEDGSYPAVTALATLATDVKAIVGASTIVTYGADWTEYGSDVIDGGSEVRFPLDPLWASDAVDVVGIDYYAPLADWRDEAGHLDSTIASSTYDIEYLAGNILRGEGFDWYYADDAARAAQDRTAITDGLGKPWTFRVKDIKAWWSSAHHERVGGVELASATAWVPQGKPIWFTEVGCPAVDKGANQPSVFPDPKSSENHLPYFSSGNRDDLIQRRYLQAMLGKFDPAFGATIADNPVSAVYGAPMIDASAIHLWTWDARPYPAFPAAIEVWSDGPNWQTGHWLTGRLGTAPMDALVEALLADSGIADTDSSALRESCDGYVIDRPMAPRAMIEPLAGAYAFDATAADGTLRVIPRGGVPVAEFAEDDLVLRDDGAVVQLTRGQETELPREASFGFTDGTVDYRRAAVTSRRLTGGSNRSVHSDLAVVSDDAAMARRAEVWLQDLWAGRESAALSLGPQCLSLTPGDVIAVTIDGRRWLLEIDATVDAEARQVTARSIDPDVFSVPLLPPRLTAPAIPAAVGPVEAMLLDLPTIETSEPPILTRLAVFAKPWPTSVTVWTSPDGAGFQPAAVIPAPSCVGETLDPLPAGPSGRWDRGNTCRVRLYGGALTSVSDARVLAGANAAAVQCPDGAWEILQFANAELVDTNTYRLSRLLRGQAGSEYAIADPLPPGAPFVLLDMHLAPVARGLNALGRPIFMRLAAAGRNHDDPTAVALTVTPQPTALLPLSPVHVKAARETGGIRISWIRRTRIDGDGWGIEVPLGEDSEAYTLDIFSGGSVVRSIACSTPEALYADADELADFGAPQGSLHLRVAQVSATVGAGRPTELTLTL
jgi:hypothetical protein